MSYTKKQHAKNLIKILEMESTCTRCPACSGRDTESYVCDTDCRVCRTFIGLPLACAPCPCDALGPAEAAKRSWIALEEGGYL